LRQMLEAVQHCHERGFVHRDLKVDNFVFTTAASSAPELKLIDFGLADRCDGGRQLGGHAGTTDYSPPEALAGGASFGPAADMWAVGAIFFLLLTGEPLIKVEEPMNTPLERRHMIRNDVVNKVLDARYLRLRIQSACSRLPSAAADLLQEMLCQNPKRRITADEALRHPFIHAPVAE